MPMLLYDVMLRGVSLCGLADEIIVRDIIEMPPTEDKQSTKRAMHAGTRVHSIIRRSLPVKVVFNVRAYDGERRAEIMDKIAAWVGNGGVMTISTRPGKRLFVKPEKMPRLDSSLKWTEDLSVTLTAYEQPYWEEETAVSASIPTTLDETTGLYVGSAVMTVPGNLSQVPVTGNFRAPNSGETLTDIKIVVGETFFELTGLEMTGGGLGDRLYIDYSDEDQLQIHRKSVSEAMSGAAFNPANSLLHARTAESSDDILIPCNKATTVFVYANVQVVGVIQVRGRWL